MIKVMFSHRNLPERNHIVFGDILDMVLWRKHLTISLDGKRLAQYYDGETGTYWLVENLETGESKEYSDIRIVS